MAVQPALHPEGGHTSPLAYAGGDADVAHTKRRWALLAVASVALALLGFPLGAFTSIIMEGLPNFFPRRVAERGGFMLFAVIEGLGAACGLLAALRMRRKKDSTYWTAVAGMVLGAAGSGIVLFMIFVGKIR